MNEKLLMDEMKLRNFSKNTIKTYLYYNALFLKFINKGPRSISGRDIKKYLLYLIDRNNSSSTVNLAHNALSFYYGTILRRNVKSIPFQKREQKERRPATQTEIRKMIDVLKNQKHKLLISLLYATGVRVSELIRIKVTDLDFERKLLRVRQGKGKKDRITILSGLVIFEVQRYLKIRPYKSEYLFVSCNGHITTATVRAVIKQAKKKAEIIANITPHILRHSFATHHMESGTRTEYIQKMLGHNDIRTTRIYERVSTKHLEKIKSPHDEFNHAP